MEAYCTDKTLIMMKITVPRDELDGVYIWEMIYKLHINLVSHAWEHFLKLFSLFCILGRKEETIQDLQ